MFLRALIRFNDKITGEKRMPGDIFEASEERGRELIADPRNVAEEITEKEAAPAPEEPKKATKAPAAKKPAAKKKK